MRSSGRKMTSISIFDKRPRESLSNQGLAPIDRMCEVVQPEGLPFPWTSFTAESAKCFQPFNPPLVATNFLLGGDLLLWRAY